MLYRYAEYKGYDISKRNDLTNYTAVSYTHLRLLVKAVMLREVNLH